MNNLLVNKEVLRLKYLKETGNNLPQMYLSSESNEYISWLETIATKAIPLFEAIESIDFNLEIGKLKVPFEDANQTINDEKRY